MLKDGFTTDVICRAIQKFMFAIALPKTKFVREIVYKIIIKHEYAFKVLKRKCNQ